MVGSARKPLASTGSFGPAARRWPAANKEPTSDAKAGEVRRGKDRERPSGSAGKSDRSLPRGVAQLMTKALNTQICAMLHMESKLFVISDFSS